MSDEGRYFRVGAFVLGGLLLAAAAVVVVAGGKLFARPVLVETYFDESVQGLDVGSPVKFRGVQLGTVKTIGLVRDEYSVAMADDPVKSGSLVLVRMEIYGMKLGRIREAIGSGLRLKLTPLGITGVFFLQADYLDAAKYPPMQISWEPEELYVPSAPSAITEISSAAERLMSRIDKLDVEELLTNLNVLLESVNRAVETADVDEVQRSVGSLLDDLRRTSSEVRSAVQGSEARRTAEDARETLRQVNLTLLRVQQILDGGGDDLGSALENLRVASENLRDVSETARRYPSLLLLGQPPPAAGDDAR